jgi:hypothetical protein
VRAVPALVALAALAAAAVARGADGAIELNQEVALAGDVLPGDTPGFPITLSQPGRYRLTGNLMVESEFDSAVFVESNDVSVDLGGFQVLGPNRCTTGGTCTSPGSGVGIDALAEVANTHVYNGVVRGLGSSGVRLSEHSQVDHVRAFDNAVVGIAAGAYSRVSDCLAEQNGTGIEVFTGRVERSVARGNLAGGIVTFGQAEVRDNTASMNGGTGITAQLASITVRNSARGNGIDGIRSPGFVRSNVAQGNGRCGIVAFNHALLEANSTGGNGFAGLHFRIGQIGYKRNVVVDATPFTMSVPATNLGGNLCGTCTAVANSTCDF